MAKHRAVAALVAVALLAAATVSFTRAYLRDPVAANRSAYARHLERNGATWTHADPATLQTGLSDCGVAVAAEVLRLAGLPVPDRERLADHLVLTRRGITLTSLGRVMEAHGLRVRRSTLADVQRSGGVLIPLLRYRHFIVVRGADGSGVTAFDPLIGEVHFPWRSFHELWAGDGLVVEIASGLDGAATAAAGISTHVPTLNSGEVP